MAYCRLVIVPGPQTAFSSADNPIARTPSAWTRLLTFLYLPVFNLRLLLQPNVLSFDWGMDALPRVTSLWDRRNAQSACFYSVLVGVAWGSCRQLLSGSKEVTHCGVSSTFPQYHIQKVASRKSRSKRKRMANNTKYQAFEAAYHQQQQEALPCRDCNNNNSSGYVYEEVPPLHKPQPKPSPCVFRLSRLPQQQQLQQQHK